MLVAAATLARAAEPPAPTLRGLVFLSSTAAFNAQGIASVAEPIDLSQVKLLDQPAFVAQLRRLIGQSLTAATLNEIQRLSTAHCAALGRAEVHVTIPRQDVTSGIVQVMVIGYRAGQVLIEGAAHFSPGLYRAAIGVQPGQSIDMAGIQAGLRQINASEYRSAGVALQPGTEPGTVDVVVHAEDRLPITVSAGYANSGVTTTGRDQWTFGLSLANTLRDLDDVLAYQALSSNFSGRAPFLLANSLSYALALPGGEQFSILASYAMTHTSDDTLQSGNGRSVQVSPRLSHEIFVNDDLQVSLIAGYDFKSTNNDLMFGGSTVIHGSSDISQFELAGLLARGDAWGRNDISLAMIASPGRMFPGNEDASFRGLLPDARAQYIYLRLDAARVADLTGDLAWWIHAVGQIASNGLLPSEQLNAGGMTTVRGYPASTVRGDAGMMLSNELRFSASGVDRLFGHDFGDRFQPYLFVDYAAVSARQAAGLLSSDGTLTSFGPGVRIELDRYATFEFDIGGQLRVGGDRRYPGQFFNVSINLRY